MVAALFNSIESDLKKQTWKGDQGSHGYCLSIRLNVMQGKF